jgi:hypothetical protein
VLPVVEEYSCQSSLKNENVFSGKCSLDLHYLRTLADVIEIDLVTERTGNVKDHLQGHPEIYVPSHNSCGFKKSQSFEFLSVSGDLRSRKSSSAKPPTGVALRPTWVCGVEKDHVWKDV